jgi:phenylpyruvate tautomerase PptA (4-oxalocrotonate tautomerase family)
LYEGEIAMPVMLIEVGKKFTKEQEIELIHAAHSALQESFRIQNNDVHVRLMVHEPHRFLVPITEPILYPQPELFTLVSVDCYSGRSLETKRKFYQMLVNNFEKIGIPKDHIKIIIRETSKENLGIRGGIAGCDVDLNYSVEI